MQLDRFGRRVLLFWSATFVTISLAAMGTFFFFQLKWGATEASSLLGWLPLVALIIFFIAYSSGLANVPFVIMGELFPSRYRFILGPISSSFNLLCVFIVVRCFPIMQASAMGKHGTFWFFMCCTSLSIIFTYFLLPETKGKTLEDIEKLFSKKYDGSHHQQSISSVTADIDRFNQGCRTNLAYDNSGDNHNNIHENDLVPPPADFQSSFSEKTDFKM